MNAVIIVYMNMVDLTIVIVQNVMAGNLMKTCYDCGRQIFGTSHYCWRCQKKRREEMPGTSEREYGQGKPNGVFLLPFLDIHYLCQCIWVWDYKAKMHRLKYMTYSCPAQWWHRELGMAPNGRNMSGKVQVKSGNSLTS